MAKMGENNKGIWTDKKGSDTGAEINENLRLQFRSELESKFKRTFNALKKTEELIDMAGTILHLGQPPITGRISLRWWKKRAISRFIEPIVVRWEI